MKNNKEDWKAIIIGSMLVATLICSLVFCGYAMGCRRGYVAGHDDATEIAIDVFNKKMAGNVIVEKRDLIAGGFVWDGMNDD